MELSVLYTLCLVLVLMTVSERCLAVVSRDRVDLVLSLCGVIDFFLDYGAVISVLTHLGM